LEIELVNQDGNTVQKGQNRLMVERTGEKHRLND
jgi:hypothetical protein